MATDIGELLVKLSADLKNLDSGLKQARGQLEGFKGYANSFASSLKKTLAFAGVAVGLYEIASALKSFATSAAMVGARTETLGVSMQVVGKNAGVSAATLNYYTQELKKLGITTQESMSAVTRFLVQGMPLDKITQLADVARNQAALVGKNTSEAFNDILTGITTQQPEILRKYLINIGNLDTVLKSALSGLGLKSTQEIDPVTKSLILLNATIEASKRSAGAYEAQMETVGKRLKSLERYIQEAKAALWDFFKPIMEGIVGAQTQAFKSLEAWAKSNQAALREAGKAVGEWVRWVFAAIKAAIQWTHDNWELLKTLAQFFILTKVTGWIIGLGTALHGVVKAITAFTVAAKAAQLAAGGWLLVIGKLMVGLAALGAYKTMTEGAKAVETTEEAGLLGEAWVLVPPEKKAPAVAKPAAAPPVATPEQAAAEAKAAFEKVLAESKKMTEGVGKAGGSKAAGKAAKKLNEDLLSYLAQYLEAKRRLELKDAEESYNTFKAAQEKKKAELDLALAAGKITGREYHQATLAMAQAEADQALKLIDAKIAKEKEAYAWAQKELQTRAKAGEISPAALDLSLKRLQVEHAARLQELEGEAGRDKIKLQKELLDLQKQEYQNRQQIQDIMAAGVEEAALGPLAEKEAEINRLLRERGKLREELIRLGATEAQVTGFDAATKALQFNKEFGDQIKGYTNIISGFFGDLSDAIMNGEKDLRNTFKNFFSSLFKQSLEPALKQMTQWITDAFKSMFGSMGGAITNALMGAIGLVGMLLTSGGGKSSFTASGVQSSVTGHEAVRGIIAGETSIPIAEIGVSLQDALVPTNSILSMIEQNTRGGGRGGGQININIQGIQEAIEQAMSRYFREYLLMGARG